MLTIRKNLTEINRNVKSDRDIKFIVVHYTGNQNDTAYNNTKYFKSQNRGASAHYFVDKDSIWQCVEDKDVAWHCGTKSKYYHSECRNANSIGVEMCDSVKRNSAVEENTVELVRYLMGTYKVPIENVVRHYDVTHKLCPVSLVDDSEWSEFKRKLGGSEEMTSAEKQAFAELEKRIAELEDKLGVKYGYVDENMPEWAREAVSCAVEKGIVKGDENGNLGLSYNDLRSIVREWRAGVYK